MKPLALNRIALVLAFAGIYVSGVLSIGAYFSVSIPCGTSHGCDVVAAHPSSHLLGIPNAYLGFLFYLVMAALVMWRMGSPSAARRSVVLGYALTGLGTLASLLLTFVSFAIIGATCIWCLASAGIMIALLIVHSLLMQARSTESEPASYGVLASALGLACLVGLAIEGVGMTALAGKRPDLLPDVPLATIVPADAHIYGDPNAPVTIVEFGDLVCPSCKAEFPLIQKYIGEHQGQVRYIFRHFPLFEAQGHGQAGTAAISAEIAAEKGQFWPFIGAMYSKDESELQSIDGVLAVARAFDIDPEKAVARMNDQHDPAFQRMARDLKDGGRLGIHSTPTFILLAPNVKPYPTNAELLFRDLAGAPYNQYIK